ncbi:Fc.00g106540.m01.CDS01 [Cosmosporella sp. VM-42]
MVAVSWCASDSGSNGLPLANDSSCDCFLINGSIPTYYANHMFFDFRSLLEYANVPDVVEDPDAAASAPASTVYFRRENWTRVWDLQTWDNSFGPGEGLSNDGTVLMVNSRSNVFIRENLDNYAASDTYLTLRTKRVSGFQTAAEFQSVKNNFQYVSMRMLARTVGSAGAVTGMFTYRDSTGKLADIQESDIEILTGGPRNKIQYTNQPSYTDDGGDIPEATRNATTPDWSQWVVHRLDWTPEEVIWYVDGEETTRIKFQTPREACDLHFSAWSDGGTWSGNMSKNHEASQQIQWIEVLYNTTDKNLVTRDFGGQKREEKGCIVVCSIDDTPEAGRSAILWDSAAMSIVAHSWKTWMMALTLGVTVWIQIL